MTTELDLGKYALGRNDVEDHVFKPRKGLSEEGFGHGLPSPPSEGPEFSPAKGPLGIDEIGRIKRRYSSFTRAVTVACCAHRTRQVGSLGNSSGGHFTHPVE